MADGQIFLSTHLLEVDLYMIRLSISAIPAYLGDAYSDYKTYIAGEFKRTICALL